MSVKPGNTTSERNGTLLTHIIAVGTAVAGILVYTLGDKMPEWLLGLMVGLPTLISGAVQANYNTGRAAEKIADKEAGGGSESGE